MIEYYITFIIPLYNYVSYSDGMFKSLLETLPTNLVYEIILVDDASTDDTNKWLNHIEDNRVHIITNKKNLGYAKSNNIAAKYAKGHILALLNNDLILLNGWLEPMLELLNSSVLHSGIIGNVQYRVDDNTVDHVGIDVNHQAKVEHIQTIGHNGSHFKEVFAVTGACFLVFRDDFLKVGGFDENYVNGGEDVDLCLKLRALGKYSYVSIQSHVKHHVSLSRDRTSLINEKNSQRLFLKWKHLFIQEIKNAWLTLLITTENVYHPSLVDFHLQSEIVARTPHVVSLIAAKSVFLREECRWHKILDKNQAVLEHDHVTEFSGVCWEEQATYPWIDHAMWFVLPKGRCVDHVFISGKLHDFTVDDANQPIDYEIVLEVNGLQKKSWKNVSKGHFNLLMDNLLIVPDYPSMFSITVYCTSRHTTKVSTQAWKALTIAHIVMNDQIVLDFHKPGH